MVVTYLIKSLKDHSYYVGITNDPIRRIKDHNSGQLKTTAIKRPWVLVYSRVHADYLEARRHEKWLKKKSKEYKDKLAQLAPPDIGGVK
jgi:putative endonuclease